MSIHPDDKPVRSAAKARRGSLSEQSIVEGANVQQEESRSRKCFVIMPSGGHDEYGQREDEANFVYEHIIEPAVDTVLGPGRCDRESDSLEPGAITAKIIQKIKEYDFAVVDITGGNPNVFFELGVRHSLRKKTTIILKQSKTTIPFDIGNYRVLDYSPFKFEEARRSLEDIFRDSHENKYSVDRSVVDMLGDYEIIFKDSSTNDQMSWGYYFAMVRNISEILKSSQYIPDAIIGISNGWMIYCDFLHRAQMYKPDKVKFLGLWANRDLQGRYFNCKANEALIRGILDDLSNIGREVNLLLVDDNVSGWQTSKLAYEFIKEIGVGGVQVNFLPLFFNRTDVIDRIIDIIIWRHSVI